jgi:hypothetical protein
MLKMSKLLTIAASHSRRCSIALVSLKHDSMAVEPPPAAAAFLPPKLRMFRGRMPSRVFVQQDCVLTGFERDCDAGFRRRLSAVSGWER